MRPHLWAHFSGFIMSNNAQILVGKIVAPQGIRGQVRVQTFSACPMDFQHFEIICDRFAPGAFHFVRRASPTSDVIIARIDGIDTRNDAETLRGTELFILRDALPELGAGEYYQSDLIGFVVLRGGESIGTVACFQNYGAGDIIELDNGEMVSFAGAMVDMDARTITI